MKKIFLTLLISCYLLSLGLCQERSLVLKMLEVTASEDTVRCVSVGVEKFENKELAFARLKNKISKWKQNAYWEASVDTVRFSKDTILAFLHRGQKYEWDEIHFRYADSSGLVSLEEFLELKQRKLIRSIDLESSPNKILNQMGNKGYPFAQLSLSEISISEEKISGEWSVELNDFIRWDEMIVKGNSKIKARFLQGYLGIHPNKTYREDRSEAISEKIENLAFVKEIKPAEIEFVSGKARVYNYLEKVAANQFDGIIGFQTNEDDNKLELTGEVNLLLQNTFLAGESIGFNWQKVDEDSQNLSVEFIYPYLITSSLGLDFTLDIEKKDTSYISTGIDMGIRFSQSGKNYSKLFFKRNSSSLLATDYLATATVLPDYADVASNLFGFAYNFENLDYSFNPKRGWILNLNLATGKHKIKKNSAISSELYDDVDLSGTIIDAEWTIELNVPIQQKISLRFRSKSGIRESNDLFQNDLFSLGGMNSLRGFNEDSFRASAYSVLTSELRFIPQQNSSFYLFYDAAYYRNDYLDDKTEDYPWGVGFGLNFATKSGIFSLNYGVGKQKNSTLDLQSAKIHFGFASRF
ncbi:BamA/TamA family outer membrane protein [Labilibaculum sp.]|uniref:BamA/TamA family outer membrane protein n=1 Tax=Labilibaculum sp. TaxID=2060723 RepID=UPI0035678A76